jgi:creatinine amidohydrolase/Fe(II)-dependent formamide hydrolase-like protein
MKIIRMEEMTWPGIKAAIESGYTTVVVGIGSTEQHGPHLPTMTDARIGDDLAERVAPGYLGPAGEAEVKLILEKGMPALTASGVLGDPRKATAAKGEVYLERLADFLSARSGSRSLPDRAFRCQFD